MADEKNGPEDEPSIDDLDELSKGDDDLTPKERFKKMSNITLLMAYDFIDKLRFVQKETLELADDKIEERVAHLRITAEQFRELYLDFCDLDL